MRTVSLWVELIIDIVALITSKNHMSERIIMYDNVELSEIYIELNNRVSIAKYG